MSPLADSGGSGVTAALDVRSTLRRGSTIGIGLASACVKGEVAFRVIEAGPEYLGPVAAENWGCSFRGVLIGDKAKSSSDSSDLREASDESESVRCRVPARAVFRLLKEGFRISIFRCSGHQQSML